MAPRPARQPSRLRPRPLDEGEDFDLHVPGSDDADKEEDDPPVPRSRGRTQGMTIEAVTQINDPSVPTQNESKSSAGDVHYFFERDDVAQENVCKLCK
jgi:hypothetical protein